MNRAPSAVRVLGPLLAAAAAVTSAGAARPAVAQDAATNRLHVTAHVGASLQDSFDGLRFGEDMVTFGLLLTAERPAPAGLQPWVEAARFVRPDFECVSGLPCTRSGWLARAGFALPFSDHEQPGLQAAARAGLGAGLAEEPTFSYLIGLGLHWRSIPWISPYGEVRWEHIAGINFTLIAVGIRLHL